MSSDMVITKEEFIRLLEALEESNELVDRMRQALLSITRYLSNLPDFRQQFPNHFDLEYRPFKKRIGEVLSDILSKPRYSIKDLPMREEA